MNKLGLSLAVTVAGLADPAVGGIINVPGNQPTIQAGIDAANPGDVVIVAQGEYFETINFNGKAITLRRGRPALDPSNWPSDGVQAFGKLGGGAGRRSNGKCRFKQLRLVCGFPPARHPPGGAVGLRARGSTSLHRRFSS